MRDGTIDEAPLTPGDTVTTLQSSAQDAFAIAVDASHLYWGSPGYNTIDEAPLSPDGTVTTLQSGQSYPLGLAVGP